MLWVFIYSLHIFYSFDTNNLVIKILLIYSIFYFIFEIILNFNKGFYKSGKLITDKNKILKRHINNTLLYDILAIIP